MNFYNRLKLVNLLAATFILVGCVADEEPLVIGGNQGDTSQSSDSSNQPNSSNSQFNQDTIADGVSCGVYQGGMNVVHLGTLTSISGVQTCSNGNSGWITLATGMRVACYSDCPGNTGVTGGSTGGSAIDNGSTGGDNTSNNGNNSGSTPTCSPAAEDSDGDGWGWENGQSCIMPGGGSNNTDNTDNTDNSDNTSNSGVRLVIKPMDGTNNFGPHLLPQSESLDFSVEVDAANSSSGVYNSNVDFTWEVKYSSSENWVRLTSLSGRRDVSLSSSTVNGRPIMYRLVAEHMGVLFTSSPITIYPSSYELKISDVITSTTDESQRMRCNRGFAASGFRSTSSSSAYYDRMTCQRIQAAGNTSPFHILLLETDMIQRRMEGVDQGRCSNTDLGLFGLITDIGNPYAESDNNGYKVWCQELDHSSYELENVSTEKYSESDQSLRNINCPDGTYVSGVKRYYGGSRTGFFQELYCARIVAD